MSDRRHIEDRLREGVSVGTIAKELNVSWATISRELKRHRTSESKHYRQIDKNLCMFRDECTLTNACGTDCFSRCSRCASAACNRVCERFEPVGECPKLSSAPYVCNGCKSRLTIGCRYRAWFYDADIANEEAVWTNSSKRQGVDCTPEQLAEMVATIKPLLKKGQSLQHIWQAHRGQFPVGYRTFYRYINLGVLDICNLELPTQVKYKPRKKRKKGEIPFRSSFVGHTYEDFKKLPSEAQMSAVEMDCVESCRGCEKAILTLHFRRYCFQLMVMMPAQTEGCVKEALDHIEMLCGKEAFSRLFSNILTDRGHEFLDTKALETSIDGSKRCSVFYCDPLQSGQKGACEKNHVELRKILPKGTSFERITNYELSVICSHVNSYLRPMLGGVSPYALASQVLPRDLLEGLAIVPVAPDEVIMRPSLLKELGLL